MLKRTSVALAGLALGACSALINPEDLPIRCGQDDDCPEQMACVDDVCEPVTDPDPDPDAGCTPSEEPELCNGFDDNCDGHIDEGHDVDEDGVTWCNGGALTGRDCNDRDPEQAPGNPEICDGRDNDCNGEFDEATCGEGETCDPATGECVSPEPDPCADDPCPEGELCREGPDEGFECVPIEADDCHNAGHECPPTQVCTDEGVCVDLGGLGDACQADGDCDDGFCLDPQTLRMSDEQNFCSRTCCTPADCPGGFVCWQPGGGFSACVSRAALSLGEGDLPSGSACATDAECASGACKGSACVDPCCEDATCGGGTSCTVAITQGATDELLVSCGDVGLGGVGSACDTNEECSSGFCIEYGYCTAPCCSSEDCGDGFICTYAAITDLDPEPQTRLCVEDVDFWGDPRHGGSQAGSPCTSPGDCRSDYCEDGFCVDTCCGDAGCGGGSSCKLRVVVGGGQLLCLP